MWTAIFGSETDSYRPSTADMIFTKLLKDAVSEEFAVQYDKFPAENHKELNINKDIWTIYAKHGPSLYFNRVDFSVIESPSLRLEVKGYLKHRFSFNEYLMSEHRDENIKSPRPHINHFKNYIFVNSKKYIQNILIVPNEVIAKLEPHIKELNPSYQLIYKIFSETGLKQLKYLPHKILSAKKKKGVPSYHKIMIIEALADEIMAFAKETDKLRKSCDLPYIFLVKRQGYKPSMINMNYYIAMINKLIEMYDIRSSEGELWKAIVVFF